MRRIRVLVVDDSAVIRRMLTDILSADPEIELVGSAGNAALALAKVRETAPDVITLDVEMPDVSGLEVLAQIRRMNAKLPVIMFSSLTQRAAATTLEALALGATDYVTKPSGAGTREAAIEQVRAQLLPRIKMLAVPAPRQARSNTVASISTVTPIARTSPRIDVLAIAASTGGPNALSTLFKQLPADFAVPIVIVQHMPPVFTRLLAERLSSTCPLAFREGVDGETVQPGEVCIAPGDQHMSVKRHAHRMTVMLNQNPPENSVRPAADVLLRSLVASYGANTMAVVLTGMGQDSLRGCEAVRAAGGWVVAQDEASSVIWGMPGCVARAGLADRVLPLAEIADEILRRTQRHSHQSPLPITSRSQCVG